jgi:hypothetical protein
MAARLAARLVARSAQRRFTVGEVERMIPSLERIFTHALQLRAALRVEEEKLERAGVRVTREWLEGDEGGPTGRETPAEAAAIRQSKLMFRAYWDALREALGEVDRLGGEIKDLDVGLVDFLARRGGEDVYLCWKFGEKTLGHWHTLEAGFRGRRPLDELIPREPSGLD